MLVSINLNVFMEMMDGIFTLVYTTRVVDIKIVVVNYYSKVSRS